MSTRDYWLMQLLKIVDPVLKNASIGRLNNELPFVQTANKENLAPLEAIARVVLGISPWLEAKDLEEDEEENRCRYAEMTRVSIKNIFDPQNPDYINTNGKRQALVELAFLVQGILRAQTQLWEKLDEETKKSIIIALKETRKIKPYNNNWLLFSAMIEVGLHKFGEKADPMRIDYALKKHEEWYLGDGIYSDGPKFHWDYYNSFVIYPMLIDCLGYLKNTPLYGDNIEWIQFENNCQPNPEWIYLHEVVIERAKRYSVILEKMISPEGTYPLIGRSLLYRFGVFHLLSQMTLMNQVDQQLSYTGIRCALTSVLKRMMEHARVFDEKGWLLMGLMGRQLNMREFYISYGSLYFCTTVFLPLGLSPKHVFWSGPDTEWSSKKIWQGKDYEKDCSID